MTNPPFDASGDPAQPQSKYGTAPYDPDAVGGPLAAPPQFARLKTLTLVSLGLYVVSYVLIGITTLNPAYLEAQLEAAGGEAVVGDIDEVVQFTTVAGGVTLAILAIISVGLYLLVYFGIARRKNWARVLGIVFAILGAVSTLSSVAVSAGVLFGSVTGVIGTIVNVAWLVVSVLWLITAFNGQLREYFARK